MTIVESDLHEPARAALAFAELGASSDDAVAAYQAVLDLDPENIDALLWMLHCRVDRSEFPQATALLERLDAVDLDQADRDDVGRLRADVLSRPGAFLRSGSDSSDDLDEARESVAEVSSVEEAQILARAYRERGYLELAVAHLERALEIAEAPREEISILSQLSSTYRDFPGKRKLAEALKACERSIAIEPSYIENKMTYTSMVAVLRELGHLDEALRHGDELVQRLPKDPFVLNAVGAVYSDLADRDGDPALARLAGDYFLQAAKLGQTRKTAVARLREFLARLATLCERYSHDAARFAGFEAQQGRIEQALIALSTRD